jgi:hypothetical protein
MYVEQLILLASAYGINFNKCKPKANHVNVNFKNKYNIDLQANFWSSGPAIGISLIFSSDQQNLLNAFADAYENQYPTDKVDRNAGGGAGNVKLVARPRHRIDFDPRLDEKRDFEDALNWHRTRLQSAQNYIHQFPSDSLIHKREFDYDLSIYNIAGLSEMDAYSHITAKTEELTGTCIDLQEARVVYRLITKKEDC